MLRVLNRARGRALLASAVAVLALAAASAASARAEPLEGLDDYVAKAMADWEVPGLAIAVVKDDAVALAKGFGVRKVGETTPVDAETLFAIGSTSKAFTAAALLIAVRAHGAR